MEMERNKEKDGRAANEDWQNLKDSWVFKDGMKRKEKEKRRKRIRNEENIKNEKKTKKKENKMSIKAAKTKHSN